MRRDLGRLADKTHDLLVVGGGIYGATAAWEAASRGLSVALVERDDFGAATSANSLKIIHGGLRYLQHADFARLRESIRERAILMNIAPHLVHPLPVLVPTYGHGLKGREALALALVATEVISADITRALDPGRRLPRGRLLSRAECLEVLPGLRADGLTGAALFYDAQAYNTERLTLAFIRSAAEAGATVANYVGATGLLTEAGRVTGAAVEDRLGGERFTVRARAVLNAAGPWAGQVLASLGVRSAKVEAPLAKAVNVITRQLLPSHAVGLSTPKAYHDRDAVLDKGNRLLFVAPWRGYSLIGTTYEAHRGAADDLALSERDLDDLLEQINQAYPGAGLKREDVRFAHRGLLPMADGEPRDGQVRLAKHHVVVDHRADGLQGLVSVLGVKYTTARAVAVQAVDAIYAALGERPVPSRSAGLSLFGGQIESLPEFIGGLSGGAAPGLSEEAARRLAFNYGSEYGRVLAYLDRDDRDHSPANEQALLAAEVRHAAREEMAQKLADVVLRRTELGTASFPGEDALRRCAAIMAAELGWSEERTERETREVRAAYALFSTTTDEYAERLATPTLQ